MDKQVMQSRQRGENFTQEEKDLFLEIMRQSASIIENKQTDTNMNKRKNMEWLNIRNKLTELTGKNRDIAQLKGFWRRAKISAKKNVSGHKRAIRVTGGGHRPPSPTPDDLKIKEMCPIDFIIEENQFDSDGVYQNADILNEMETENGAHNSTIIDIDINEDIQNDAEAEVSFVNEVVTVADVFNDEVLIEQEKKVHTDLKESKFKSTPIRPKPRKTETSHKGIITSCNIDLKKRMKAHLEEEHAIKIKFHKHELSHQEFKQKLEIELLLLEKEKKLLELEIQKKN